MLLENKIALITGASRGIGAAVAKRYAAEGAHVILVARTVGGLEEVDNAIKANAAKYGGGTATLVPLDLLEHDKIDQLSAIIYERFGRLDILLGNAAMLGGLRPVPHYEPKMWEQVFSINVTANWRLIRACDPLLRMSDAGRALFVTSGIAQRIAPFWGAYAASKAALEMMVNVYNAEMAETKVRSILVNPGVVRTRMRKEAFPGEDPLTLPTPEEITERFITCL